MQSKTIRIANIANRLCIYQQYKEASLLKNLWNKISGKEPRLKKELTEKAIDLAEYLHNSEKLNYIDNKLKIYNNINSLIKALKFLSIELKTFEDPKRINQIQEFIQLIQQAKKILDQKEINVLGQNISSSLLFNKPLTANIKLSTTEPLEDHSDDSVEDGEISAPLEEHEQTIK